jgi:act minimal PKS chain-length factor (CLF/KS beta)
LESGVSPPVVVTGLGVVAPNGLGVDEYWSATLNGTSGIRATSRFDTERYATTLSGEVTGFDPGEHLPGRLIPRTDHMTRLALVAADWALDDAGVDRDALSEFGSAVVTAASGGGFEFAQRELEALWRRGPRHVSAYQSFAWFYAVNTGQISIKNRMRGPGGVIVTEQAGGLDAVGHARRHLRGRSELALTGGVDSSLCPLGIVAQLPNGRISSAKDPRRAYLPFDSEADGYVIGEGGAILVLERADAATTQRRQVYGEIAGYAATFDPRPGTGREPGLRRAVEQALADAGVVAPDVDAVFADAAGVPDLDLAEASAISAVFGPYGVPVTAPKTLVGRLNAGGAALDVATALLTIRDGVIPATANVERPAAHCPIDLVAGQPRETRVRTALVLARGYGGFNAAMVLRAVAD